MHEAYAEEVLQLAAKTASPRSLSSLKLVCIRAACRHVADIDMDALIGRLCVTDCLVFCHHQCHSFASLLRVQMSNEDFLETRGPDGDHTSKRQQRPGWSGSRILVFKRHYDTKTLKWCLQNILDGVVVVNDNSNES